MGKNTKVFLHLGSLHRYFLLVGVDINQESSHSRRIKKGKCALTLRRNLTPPDVNRVTFRAVSAMVGTTQTPDSFQGFFFMRTMRVNTLGFLSYRFFELGGVDINQGTIRRSNHVMR